MKLENIKEQTEMKINLVAIYVNNWLYVVENTKKNNILFVDCMCNTGMYDENKKGTALRVLDIFILHANSHKNKNYILFLNDKEKGKIKFLKDYIENNYQLPNNIYVNFYNKDVNDLFDYLDGHLSNYFSLIFVDPYNFGAVNLNKYIHLIDNNYCETFFNFFTSDIQRNHDSKLYVNKREAIEKSLKDIFIDKYESNEQCLKAFEIQLRTCRNIKFVFSYEFKNMNNRNIYYIVYATPNVKGLDKLKTSLWEVFKGAPMHINKRNRNQLDFFEIGDVSKEEYYLNNYLPNVIEESKNYFTDSIFSYDDYLKFICEETMLRSGHIIKKIIDPCIKNGTLIYMKKVGNNRKKSTYRWVIDNE
ncbi:MAG: three-Cys-motif partner protein TcmP [Erysipelotrichaceae bacterium]|nr:three-Cys-motif partner protein TcmP [Erysipelotrichaceae bacterium]